MRSRLGALRVCERRDRAIYQSTSERTTPGGAGNLTRLMRSRHATVSQLVREEKGFGWLVGRSVGVGDVGGVG